MDHAANGTVIGVDPGLADTGYAVLTTRDDDPAAGSGLAGRSLVLVEAGLVRTKPGVALASRLQEIYHGLFELFQEHRPQSLIVEDLYSHYRHPRTAILMGHARGVVFLAGSHTGARVYSLAPSRVKQALTGRGNATKDQMQRMVQSYLRLKAPPDPDHIADAMALAIAYHHFNPSLVEVPYD